MSTITAIAIALAAAMTVTVIERRAEVSVSPFAITAAAVVPPVRGAHPLIRVVRRAATRLSAPRGRRAGVYQGPDRLPAVCPPRISTAAGARDSPPADEERQELTPAPGGPHRQGRERGASAADGDLSSGGWLVPGWTSTPPSAPSNATPGPAPKPAPATLPPPAPPPAPPASPGNQQRPARLIVDFALKATTSANCIRCEFATVCDPASPAGRKPGLSRAYESRGDLSASRATQVSDMAITSC